MIETVRRHRDLIGQLARFGLTGGLATVLNVGIYWAGSDMLHMNPNVAWTAGFLAAVVVGYMIHSMWSFRGHGTRGNLLRTGGRFFAVALIGFAINSFWVWLFTQHFHLPTWAPIPFTMFVTPLFIFTLNRQWVFGQ